MVVSAGVSAGFAAAIALISIAPSLIFGAAYQATYLISITYVAVAIVLGLLLGLANAVGAVVGLAMARDRGAAPGRKRIWAAAAGSFLASAAASLVLVVPAIHTVRGGRWTDMDDPTYIAVVLMVGIIGGVGTATLQTLRERSRI